MNPHSAENFERSRSPNSIFSFKKRTEIDDIGTSQPDVQEDSDFIAHGFQVDSSETNIDTTSSDLNLEHAEKKQQEDPESPVKKLMDFMQEMRDVDIEKCYQDYKTMMESRDRTFTKEEVHAEFRKPSTKGYKKTESRYGQEEDEFLSERDRLQKKVDELCVKMEAFEKKEKNYSHTDSFEKEIDKIKQEYEEKYRELNDNCKKALEKRFSEEMEKENKLNEDIRILQRQIQTYQEMFLEKTETETKLKEDNEKLKKHIEANQETLSGQMKKNIKLTKDIGKLRKEFEAKQEMESKLFGEVEHYKMAHEMALNQSKEEINKLEKENRDLRALKRLSKEMHSVTNLNDSNAPTKIAEKYNELYDNEWTDAFNSLTNEVYQDESAIKELLDLIQAAYSFCKDAAVHQMENLKKALTNVSSLPRDASVVEYSIDPQTEKMLEEIRKSQKMSAETLFKNFEYSEGFKAVYKRVRQYTVKCLEICWLMNMHNPPVALGKPPAEGSPLDNSMYKEYTKTGFTVQYVVWLPLLLHENGALLQKGVAQPYPRDKSIRQRRTKTEDANRESQYSGRYPHSEEKAPLETNVDDCFKQPDRTQRSTTKSHLRETTPATVSSSSMGPDNYKFLYGENTGNYATNVTPKQQTTSTTATSKVFLYPNSSSSAVPRTHTSSSRTSTGNFRANYSSPVDDPYYDTPRVVNVSGREYVKYQGQYYTYSQWIALKFGSSNA
ncbi:synaptonemal complex protein 1-like [Saccostrea cucullata]|uniref:synaptonemal complex protein 1-like n=1 Tax=Saccostrea cuccullata TaxID=36930 RepID=UPI002ED089E3